MKQKPKKGKYPSKGMNKLAEKRPDVAKKIMGYKKGGANVAKKKMMGGGMMKKDMMMGYKKGGSKKANGGLYANIAAKKARIKAGSGETMRKKGAKGAPKAGAFARAKKTAKS